ncbi:hypothetical protein L4G92_03680 [Neisseria sp. ZJ106]|uniref:Uncharacterized protein n=1 Tax=Neisseria lisongii TaxID=2912188 RepID=A0ABY7RKB3_9NEIS|nr:hypothetical protein [Neisseria lisongii]MCF7521153.1 hypothetical protein [Neisseria lisongii]WCL72074.1 hypothetical protein PJU73_02880 [Neisseria lisongii]
MKDWVLLKFAMLVLASQKTYFARFSFAETFGFSFAETFGFSFAETRFARFSFAETFGFQTAWRVLGLAKSSGVPEPYGK